MNVTVSKRGQVTIPKHVRKALKLRPGSNVWIDFVGDGRATLTKTRRKGARPDRFDLAVGSAEIKWEGTTDEYMALIRGYDEDDPGLAP